MWLKRGCFGDPYWPFLSRLDCISRTSDIQYQEPAENGTSVVSVRAAAFDAPNANST